MKHLKRIDEAVGSITERRASAEVLLKDVVKGNTTEVEGIKLSKEMADAFLMWLKGSTYGKKFGALPFYKLFTAAFNWGLSRYTTSKELKKEYKELNIKAKEMSKAEMMKGESLDEANQSWNDIAKIMDAGLKKAIKSGSVPLSYAKDYVKSLERMAKKSKKKFFDEYGNFSEDDFIEDVEYNIANENKVNESVIGIKTERDFKPKALVDALDKAKVKYKINRLSMTLSVLDLDKKYFDDAKKIVDDLGLTVMMAKENQLTEGMSKGAIKKSIKVIDKQISSETGGDGEALDNETLQALEQERERLESMLNEADDFKPHMMYDPETGEEYKAEKPEDHDRMSKLGYVHEKPKSVDEAYTDEERMELADKGFALSDGSYPIKDLKDLKNAIMAYGRAKDQARTAKFIAKRAKALGAEDLVPDSEDFQKSLKG